LAKAAAVEPFSPEEVERARAYHLPLYFALLADLALSLAVLALLAFAFLGDGLADVVQAWAWPLRTVALSAIVLGVLFVVRLPLSFWRGYVREKRWGFSTQSPRAWLGDRLKAFGIGVVLASPMLLGFVAAVRWLPGTWPLVVGPAAAAVVLFLSFIAPVVLEPVFNRFEPLPDERLAADLRALADRAGVSIGEVLVADASRRTKKENAYVSGLGRTRRVVVYDTLLARAEPRQIELVVAHELGHRRMRHVVWGTVAAMAGAVIAVAALWLLLRAGAVLRAIGASGPGDPRIVPFVLLVAAVLQLAGGPFLAALSRGWERAADRFSLDLTGDAGLFERSHRDLARSNLSDLDPPRPIYLLLFTHPTPPERIAAARGWPSRGITTSGGPTTP